MLKGLVIPGIKAANFIKGVSTQDQLISRFNKTDAQSVNQEGKIRNANNNRKTTPAKKLKIIDQRLREIHQINRNIKIKPEIKNELAVKANKKPAAVSCPSLIK